MRNLAVVLFAVCLLFCHAAESAEANEFGKLGAPGSNCFTAQSNAQLQFKVFRQGPAPYRVDRVRLVPDSVMYPASNFATAQLDRIQRPTDHDATTNVNTHNYAFIWGNRCFDFVGDSQKCANKRLLKGNYYTDPVFANGVTANGTVSMQARPMFRSYQRANMCTHTQALYAIGADADNVKELAKKNGLTPFFRHDNDGADLLALKTDYTYAAAGQNLSRPFLIDVCIYDSRAGDPKGVFIDYEVWDKRPPEITQHFLTHLADALHRRGKELHVYTNSLVSTGARLGNGYDTNNLSPIVDAVDSFSPIIWSGATPGGYEIPQKPRLFSPVANLDDQLAYLASAGVSGAALAKIVPAISLYDLDVMDPDGVSSSVPYNPNESLLINYKVRSLHLGGLMLWRNGLVVDGVCGSLSSERIRKLTGVNP